MFELNEQLSCVPKALLHVRPEPSTKLLGELGRKVWFGSAPFPKVQISPGQLFVDTARSLMREAKFTFPTLGEG